MRICTAVAGAALLAGCGGTGEGSVTFAPGKSEIVVAADAVSAVRVAADEAREFLSAAFGVEVPVVNAPTEGRASLVLGANAWADAAGVTTNGLKRDAFRIRTVGNRVFVLGVDDADDAYKARKNGGIWLQNFQRATAFGVYGFLERFAGVRFYFPGELGTVVPRTARVVVPPTDLTDGPANTVRRYSTYDLGRWFEGAKPDELRHPAKTLNWWRLRMETEYLPCCHGTNKLRYMDRFADSHPEYFALLKDGRRHNSPKITHPGHPGQLCHTSGIWDEIYADAKAYLTGQSAETRGLLADGTLPTAERRRYAWGVNCQAGKYVDVMPQDGMIPCACPTCQAVWDNVEDKVSWASELIWGNIARAANRLKAEGVKGYLTNLAYSKYRHVPKVAIPDNVLVMVAERGPWTEADPDERARELAEYRAWNAKLGRKVWAWTYVCRGGDDAGGAMTGIPCVTPKAIGRYFQQIQPYAFGAFLESEIGWSAFQYLNYYVFAKVMWDTSVDVEAILDEHHRLMFGAAAPEMKEFYETLEEVFIRQVAGKTFDTPLGPQSERKSEYELFMRIYTPALLDRLDALFAAAERKVSAGSLEARRVAFARENLYEPLRKRARAYQANTDVKRGLERDAKSTAKNLIENGSFSEPKKGRMFGAWFGDRDDAVTARDETTYASAPASLRISPGTNASQTVVFYFRDAEKRMTLKKGQRYRLSYCIRLQDLEPTKLNGGAGVTIWDNKNIWIPPGGPFKGTQDWTYQTYEFTSDAHTGERQMPYIYLRVSNARGTVWFDDVRLEEVE